MRLLKSIGRALRFPRGHRGRFFGYLALGMAPLLAVALAMNVHFLESRLRDSAEIFHSVSTQASSQIGSLYDMASVVATNARVHTNLQNEVLPTYGRENDYPVLNRNFLKIQELINAYTLFGDFMEIRFYLPSSLVISNGASLLDMDALKAEPWYAEYSQLRDIRRWYLADRVQGSGAEDVLCAVRPVQDPMNYSSVIGYLRVDVAIERIEEIVRLSSVLDDTSCFLIDRDQGVIWHTGSVEEAAFQQAPCVQEARAAAYHEYERIGGRDYLVSVHPLSSSNMSLVYLVPKMSLARDALMNGTLQFVLLLLEILLFAAIAALFSSSLLSSRNSQLRLLNAQINPHFLYNTLDVINWQAINQNLPDIYRPIQALSRFYKITLNHGEEFIRVADEVEQVRLYLELQNLRFKNSVAYQIEVEPDIRDCYILHMVLQPIVENALLHGIREKDSQTGRIDISIRETHGQLLFTIRDDGVGMDEAAVAQLLRGSSSMGYGLSNIQQRIRLYYGRRFGMTVASRPGEGTAVCVRMPCVRGEPERREL